MVILIPMIALLVVTMPLGDFIVTNSGLEFSLILCNHLYVLHTSTETLGGIYKTLYICVCACVCFSVIELTKASLFQKAVKHKYGPCIVVFAMLWLLACSLMLHDTKRS